MSFQSEFGSSDAAAVLVDLVKCVSSTRHRKISRFFHQTTFKLKYIAEHNTDNSVMQDLLKIYFHHRMALLANHIWDDKIKTYLQNVLTYHYRKYLKVNQ